MKRAKFFGLLAGLTSTLLVATACESPDSGKRFDEYSNIVGDAPPASALCEADVKDLSGSYFVRLSHSLNRNAHILMDLTISATGDNLYTLEFQPLKSDNHASIGGGGGGPRDDAREPVGELIVVEGVTQNARGEFEIELLDVTVDGDANAATGGDILADIAVTVAACSNGFLCGNGKVEVYKPIPMPLKATIGASKLDDGESIDQDTTAPFNCEGDPI